MSISYETIITQMINELEKAKNHTKDKQDLLKHIYHVHGLCELIIKQDNLTDMEENTTNESKLIQFIENKTNVISHSQTDEEDSIFDF